MRRYLKKSAVLVLLLTVTLFYPLLAPRAHRIDQAHFEFIAPGMTREQVESIFGVPPGDYDWAQRDETAPLRAYKWLVLDRKRARALNVKFLAEAIATDQVIDLSEYAFDLTARRYQTSSVWTSRHGSFTVRFDAEDRVVSKQPWPNVRIVPPWQRWWRAWKQR